MKKAIFILFFVVSFSLLQGATRTAVLSGNWTTNSNWDCGCAPSASDNIIIPSGITISISFPGINLSNMANITITVKGVLNLSTSGINLDNGDVITIDAGGEIKGSGLGGLVFSGGTPIGVAPGSPIQGPATITGGALPITLLYFKAAQVGKAVQIEWKSAEEINLAKYVVEKSTDGITFSTYATVSPGAPQPDGTRKYVLTDENIFCTGRLYYNLQSIDNDGLSNKFDAVSVSIESVCPSLSFFPNPLSTGKLLGIQSNLTISDGDVMSIVDIHGKLVKTIPLMSSQNKIDLQLPSGLYVVALRTKAGTATERLLVKN